MSTTLSRCYAAVLATGLLAAGGCSRAAPPRPSFAAPIDNQTVSLHRDVTLACIVNHLGKHQVAWLHMDRQSLVSIGERLITQLSQFSVHHDRHKTWTLRIRNVKREDGGAYMCQVNTVPMLKQEGIVTVVVPPNIVDSKSSPSEVAVHEGKTARLTCHAEGEPPPSISWKREDNQPIFGTRPERRYNGSTLVLPRVSRKATGAYLCIANNGVPPSPSKMITLKVKFTPSIRVETQLHGAPPGSSVQLICHTEAQPRAIHYWMHRGNILLGTPSKYRIDEVEDGFRTKMLLTVHNLQEPDFDDYKCVSKNSLGEAEGTIQIYATRTVERPRTAPPRPPPDRGPPSQPYNQDRRPDSSEAVPAVLPESPGLSSAGSTVVLRRGLVLAVVLLAVQPLQLLLRGH